MAKQAAADRSDHPTTIHPVLKAALGCMDVQLEEELARYRRQRHEASRRGVPAPVAPLTTAAAIAPPSPTPAIANDANDIADLTRQPPRADDASVNAVNPPPEDDLESTKELRRQLPQPEPTETVSPVPSPSWRDRLFTPLGLSSLVVLGIATALLGSALFAPDSLNNLAGNWLTTGEPDPELSPDSPAEDAENGGIDLQGPNLANDEFDPLDLDALSTVETEPSTTDTLPDLGLPTPNSPQIRAEGVEVPSRESDLTTALLSPSAEPEPEAASSPQASPLPSPAPTPNTEDPAVANAVPGPAEGDRFYYVVASYGGESSLRQARSIVPEAYLRRFPQGVQIQMGAFGSEADAQSLIDRLQQQGVAASVYRR
ncbi:MAG: hypothetical protein HC910_05995 [Spirulinaceae cyanobacterium SM2_1_0]|nr:hypothetical protein [Spirulinaceae cyanobacterium SM2_1_0]